MAREMKDSGIEWIGEIPMGWNIQRGKNILSLLERPVLEDDGVITCFRDGEVTLRSKRREEGFTFSLQEVGYQGIEPGDLVVHGMDGFAGAIGISDSRGKATPVLNVMGSSQNKRYLMYYLRCAAYCGLFLSLATGIRVRSCDTNWNKLKVILYLIPPIEEQERITKFLDKELLHINSVIEQTRASIEEYKKLKQAVITQAVTKGIRPDRQMKGSGVEWIGEIPCDWEIISFTKSIESIVDYRGKTPEKQDNGTLLITARNIKDGVIDYSISREYVRTEDFDEIMHRGKVEIGDVLFTTEAPLGSVANADRTDFALAQRIIKFRGKQSVLNNYFLKYWIMSDCFQQNLSTFSTGSTAKGIKASKLGMLKQVLPLYDEQIEIVAYLQEKTKAIDNLISKKEKVVKELDSYKKSLIYEYVTGKKEVPA